MIWNTDISAAPKGRTVTVMKNTKSKDGVIRTPVQEFAPAYVWLATKCEKVFKTYWVPQNNHSLGRWAGLEVGELPDAWMEFITPVHPRVLSRQKASMDATVAHLGILDDAGGQ